MPECDCVWGQWGLPYCAPYTAIPCPRGGKEEEADGLLYYFCSGVCVCVFFLSFPLFGGWNRIKNALLLCWTLDRTTSRHRADEGGSGKCWFVGAVSSAHGYRGMASSRAGSWIKMEDRLFLLLW